MHELSISTRRELLAHQIFSKSWTKVSRNRKVIWLLLGLLVIASVTVYFFTCAWTIISVVYLTFQLAFSIFRFMQHYTNAKLYAPTSSKDPLHEGWWEYCKWKAKNEITT